MAWINGRKRKLGSSHSIPSWIMGMVREGVGGMKSDMTGLRVMASGAGVVVSIPAAAAPEPSTWCNFFNGFIGGGRVVGRSVGERADGGGVSVMGVVSLLLFEANPIAAAIIIVCCAINIFNLRNGPWGERGWSGERVVAANASRSWDGAGLWWEKCWESAVI